MLREKHQPRHRRAVRMMINLALAMRAPSWVTPSLAGIAHLYGGSRCRGNPPISSFDSYLDPCPTLTAFHIYDFFRPRKENFLLFSFLENVLSNEKNRIYLKSTKLKSYILSTILLFFKITIITWNEFLFF